MSIDTKTFWKEIRATAARFDPEALQRDRAEEESVDRVHLKKSERPVFLISIDNVAESSVGGAVVLMKPYAAAERLFFKTHREATAEEIAAYEGGQAQRREAQLREDSTRSTRGTQINISPESLAHALAELGLKEGH